MLSSNIHQDMITLVNTNGTSHKILEAYGGKKTAIPSMAIQNTSGLVMYGFERMLASGVLGEEGILFMYVLRVREDCVRERMNVRGAGIRFPVTVGIVNT